MKIHLSSIQAPAVHFHLAESVCDPVEMLCKKLIQLTIAIFRDLGNKLMKVDCFDEKIVYCNSPEILEIAET